MDIPGAFAILSNRIVQLIDFSFFNSKNDFAERNANEPNFELIPIIHPKLIEYIATRKIDLTLTNRYCREFHSQNSAGKFFSVGFRNIKEAMH